MKKQILTFVFMICFIMPCILILNACDSNPHKHSYTSVDVKATCTEKGYIKYSCDCGYSYNDYYATPLGHKYANIESNETIKTEATCTEYAVYNRSCSVCGHKISSTFKGNEYKQHDYVDHYCKDCGFSEYLTFELSEDENSYILTGVVNSDLTELYVPSIYKDLPVSSINAGALFSCRSLEKISLPFLGAELESDEGYKKVLGYIFGYYYYSIDWSYPQMHPNGTKSSKTYVGMPADEQIFVVCQYDEKVPAYNPMYYKDVYYHYAIPLSLTEVEIRNGTEIHEQAFYDCSTLITITIPNTIEKIKFCAFYGCDSLKNITLPLSLVEIENNVFSICDELEDITYLGTMEDWEEIIKGDSWNLQANNYYKEFNIICLHNN